MSQNQNTLTDFVKEEKPPRIRNHHKENEFFYGAETCLLPFYPHYFEKTLSPNLKDYYSQNGHLKLMKSLQVEIVQDMDKCKMLWDEFSPNKTLFDTWEFRLAFWRGYHHAPHFVLLKDSVKNLALLPLWYEDDREKYYWFGSFWQEENTFFVKDPIFVPLLVGLSPRPVELNAVSLETVMWSKEHIAFDADDPKYVLDITNYQSANNFLSKLKKKKRYNIKRDCRIIEAQHPDIIFDNFRDIDQMITISEKRFQKKGEDTDWEDPRRVETFRQVITLGQEKRSFETRMITIKVGEKFAGVDLIAIYNGCYYPLKCGYNVDEFPGIGSYMNIFEINDAVNLGMKKVDFLEIGYGWKDKWFQAIPLFKFEKLSIP